MLGYDAKQLVVQLFDPILIDKEVADENWKVEAISQALYNSLELFLFKLHKIYVKLKH